MIHYLQNWNDLSNKLSASDALTVQMKEVQDSISHFKNTKVIDKDSYLLLELYKMEKLVEVIKQNQEELSSHPKSQSALQTLVHQRKGELSKIDAKLKQFVEIQNEIHQLIDQVDERQSAIRKEIDDETCGQIFDQALDSSRVTSNFFGSRSAKNIYQVLSCVSNQISTGDMELFKPLSEKGRVKPFAGAKEGAKSLQEEIAGDLGKLEHKLYCCTLPETMFVNSFGGHAFLIEKTSDDAFRLYQSYNGQYSLQSFLAEQAKSHPNAAMSYEEFFPFLKQLDFLSHASEWNEKVNDYFADCFKIDRSGSIGKPLPEGFFNLSFISTTMQPEPVEEEFSYQELAESALNYVKELNIPSYVQVPRSMQAGMFTGASVALVAIGLFKSVKVASGVFL